MEHFFLPDFDLVTVKKVAQLEPWPRKEKGERKKSSLIRERYIKDKWNFIVNVAFY